MSGFKYSGLERERVKERWSMSAVATTYTVPEKIYKSKRFAVSGTAINDSKTAAGENKMLPGIFVDFHTHSLER